MTETIAMAIYLDPPQAHCEQMSNLLESWLLGRPIMEHGLIRRRQIVPFQFQIIFSVCPLRAGYVP